MLRRAHTDSLKGWEFPCMRHPHKQGCSCFSKSQPVKNHNLNLVLLALYLHVHALQFSEQISGLLDIGDFERHLHLKYKSEF